MRSSGRHHSWAKGTWWGGSISGTVQSRPPGAETMERMRPERRTEPASYSHPPLPNHCSPGPQVFRKQSGMEAGSRHCRVHPPRQRHLGAAVAPESRGSTALLAPRNAEQADLGHSGRGGGRCSHCQVGGAWHEARCVQLALGGLQDPAAEVWLRVQLSAESGLTQDTDGWQSQHLGGQVGWTQCSRGSLGICDLWLCAQSSHP